MSRTALVVMARYPKVGAVKTRLARAIGAERACQLYRAFLRDISMRFTGDRRTLVWAFLPPERDFRSVVGDEARWMLQEGGDLGQRMRNTFRRLFAEGCARVIMMGADVPHLRDEWLDEAERRLHEVDVVLGPSADGGYYLIAMRAPHDLFSGIAMSTPAVLAATLRKAAANGLHVHLLPKSFDVDDASDLEQLRRLLANEEMARRLPATAALLNAWQW